MAIKCGVQDRSGNSVDAVSKAKIVKKSKLHPQLNLCKFLEKEKLSSQFSQKEPKRAKK